MRRRVDETAWAALDPDTGRINQSALGGVWTWGTRREAVAYVRENGEMYLPPVKVRHIVKVRIVEVAPPKRRATRARARKGRRRK